MSPCCSCSCFLHGPNLFFGSILICLCFLCVCVLGFVFDIFDHNCVHGLLGSHHVYVVPYHIHDIHVHELCGFNCEDVFPYFNCVHDLFVFHCVLIFSIMFMLFQILFVLLLYMFFIVFLVVFFGLQ